ncbi:hypothetical protein SteCoe_15266 [Stentor coeruleus]|uniref:Uncharacterized protein n=1 Tax=Stentor coeruleus TaxID=5963 RepID=A0A1R2C3W9_9CILI|nr:hypothetical protein SteCoe_15266 [Stentor coeruleus]
MDNQEIQALEKFILSKLCEKAKKPNLSIPEDLLKAFPPESPIKKYLEARRLLASDSTNPDLNEILQQMKSSNSPFYNKCQLHKWLIDYDKTLNPSILQEINKKYFNFSFDYAPPRNVQSQEAEIYPEKLDLVIQNLSVCEKDEKAFNSLTDLGKLFIDITNTSDKIFKTILKSNYLCEHKKLPIRLIEFMKTFKITEYNWCFQKMIKSQLKDLSKIDKNVWKNDDFVKAWVMKKYYAKSEEMNISQKYEYFKYVFAKIENNKQLPNSIKSVLLYNILICEIKLGKCEEVWFMKYLPYHRSYSYYLESGVDGYSYNTYSHLFCIDLSLGEDAILRYYIEGLFEKGLKIYNKLSKFLKEDYLMKFKTEALQVKGEPLEKLDKKYINSQLLTSIELEPCKDNPKEFTRKENVKISMRIKNIQRLLVKVLELNPKNYYMKSNQEITSNIKLDGLVAKSEYTYEFSESPQIRLIKEFEFSELANKVGIFVIEFFGNSRQSRIIIKKGSLRYISKQIPSGHEFYILNEDNELCKKSGLYLDTRYYESDKTGRILIPYAKTSSQKNIILTDRKISEFVQNFPQLNEYYKLRTAFIIHEEQFVAGKTVTIYLKPKLFINGVQTSCTLLKKPKCSVKFTDCDNILSIKNFGDLEIDDSGKALELSFEFPAHISKLDIEFSSEVELNDKTMLPLNSLYVKTFNHTTNIVSLFLCFNENGYEFLMKGRNGEPIINQTIKLELSHVYWNNPISYFLTTNSQGKIILGQLSDIKSMKASFTNANNLIQYYSWEISNFKEKIEYPENIRICEGDEIKIQVKSEYKEKGIENCVRLYSIVKAGVIDSEMKFLKHDKSNNCVIIKGLRIGQYNLTFIDINHTISIHILEGGYFDRNVILQETQAIVKSRDYLSIGIKDVKVSNSRKSSNKNTITVKVSGNTTQPTSVYALFFNYLSEETNEIINTFSILSETDTAGFITFTRPYNTYMPSTLLDQEYQYILDRKQLPRFIGNSLLKPQILLKRNFIKNTETETQKAQTGDDFSEQNMQKCKDMRKYSQDPDKISGSNSVMDIPVDFLRNPAQFVIKTVEENTCTIEIPGDYSQVVLILYNSNTYAHKLVPLVQNPKHKHKDLRLLSSAINTTEVCKSKILQAEDEFKVEFSSTLLNNIDSFEKLFFMLQKLILINKSTINLKEWGFLVDWPSLTIEKKLEFYDKFTCHELNLFIYNRDKRFFTDVVLPFLQTKMKKDMIDKFLCAEELREYANFTSISKLNNLEKTLLACRLQSIDVDLSQAIVKLLLNEAEAIKTNIQLINERIEAILKNTPDDKDEKPEVSEFSPKRDEQNKILIGGKQFNLMTRSKNPIQAKAMAIKKRMRSSSSSSQDSCMRMPSRSSSSDSQDSCVKMKRPPSISLLKKSYKKAERCDSISYEKDSLPDGSPMMLCDQSAKVPVPDYYKCSESTKEFKETYYYSSKENRFSLTPGLFSELALCLISNKPWLSDKILESTQTLTEILTVLSFASLPFKAEKHSGTSCDMIAKSPCIVFYKELSNAELNINPLIIVAAKYLSYDTSTKNLTEVNQFIKETLYTCRVTVTNTTESQISACLLHQIPEGSIPITPPHKCKTNFLTIETFTTKTIEFKFYFPHSGIFDHNPGNLAIEGKIVAKIQEKTIKVSNVLDFCKLESFKDLVLSGRKDLILEYLRNKNLKSQDFSLEEIYWMMKKKDFWLEVVQIYRNQLQYNVNLWGFGFLHQDRLAVSEVLTNNDSVIRDAGWDFSSGLLKTSINNFGHVEFDPLVNARAYQLGNQNRIANTRLREVYKDFLLYLLDKKILEDSDLICLCQYFIYQERFFEAKNLYPHIKMSPSKKKIKKGPLQIQYDYLTCYLDINQAHSISSLYKNYPITTWKKYFSEVLKLLEDTDFSDITLSNFSNKEPTLNFTIENNFIHLTYENVENCTIRIYEIDLEVLFSKNPFLIKDAQGFSYVKANAEVDIQLTGNSFKVELEECKGKNVLVEVDYKTYTVSKSYFSNLLTISCVERYGVIKVMDLERNPRTAAYVKSFAKKKNGNVEFYKDGYTDIRGKFDYVSLSSDILSSVERFALLIVDDQLGSLVYEVAPPPQ